MKLSDLQEQQKMISQEAMELYEQCNNYLNEIECLNGTSELAIYRAVEKEINKWEREARWLSEYPVVVIGPTRPLGYNQIQVRVRGSP